MKKLKDHIYKIKIPIESEGLRLDQFLGETDFIKNRSQALKLILENRVTFNEQILKASHKLKSGTTLVVTVPEQSEEKMLAYEIPIEIIYEDSDVLVINKPSGLVVHPAPGHQSDTLVNALFHHKKLATEIESSRPGIVHRLDKETSGLLVLARNKKSEEHLIQQFKNRTVKRIYGALSLRAPQPANGTIRSYLCRHPIFRKKFISIEEFKKGAKEACTHYQTKKIHDSQVSWLECQLSTGRTHQIRVHLSSINCPLLGDRVYGHKLKDPRIRLLCKDLNRVALHAQSLKFIHPRTEKWMNFHCPWPDDLKKLLEKLKFIDYN